MEQWRSDKDKSDFSSVWDLLSSDLGGGRVISLESQYGVGDRENSLPWVLDTYCGADLLHILPDNSCEFLASRIQQGGSWRSFTIRWSRSTGHITEFEKRRRDIASGRIYPRWTIQAYIGSQVSCAAILTTDLWFVAESLVKRGWEDIRSAPDGNQFMVIRWDQCEQVIVREA